MHSFNVQMLRRFRSGFTMEQAGSAGDPENGYAHNQFMFVSTHSVTVWASQEANLQCGCRRVRGLRAFRALHKVRRWDFFACGCGPLDKEACASSGFDLGRCTARA